MSLVRNSLFWWVVGWETQNRLQSIKWNCGAKTIENIGKIEVSFSGISHALIYDIWMADTCGIVID